MQFFAFGNHNIVLTCHIYTHTHTHTHTRTHTHTHAHTHKHTPEQTNHVKCGLSVFTVKTMTWSPSRLSEQPVGVPSRIFGKLQIISKVKILVVCLHSPETNFKFLKKTRTCVNLCYKLRRTKQYELRTYRESSPVINFESTHIQVVKSSRCL